MSWLTVDTLEDTLGRSLRYPLGCLQAMAACHVAHRDDSVTVPGARYYVDMERYGRLVGDIVDWVESQDEPILSTVDSYGDGYRSLTEGRLYDYVVSHSYGGEACLTISRSGYARCEVDGWMCPSPTAAAVDIWRVETGRLVLEDDGVDVEVVTGGGSPSVRVSLRGSSESWVLSDRQVRELADGLAGVAS